MLSCLEFKTYGSSSIKFPGTLLYSSLPSHRYEFELWSVDREGHNLPVHAKGTVKHEPLQVTLFKVKHRSSTPTENTSLNFIVFPGDAVG